MLWDFLDAADYLIIVIFYRLWGMLWDFLGAVAKFLYDLACGWIKFIKGLLEFFGLDWWNKRY
jgi:hypothetical protein